MGFFEITFYDLCNNKFGQGLGNFIFRNRFLEYCETLLEENEINPNDLYKKKIPFTLARQICTIVENTEAKIKHLENLK